MCYQAFCVFNVAETVDSLGGTGIDVESMALLPADRTSGDALKVLCVNGDHTVDG